jgi:hypothetical protein
VLNVPVTGHGALWRRRQAPLVPTHPKVRWGGCESCSVCGGSLRTVVPWRGCIESPDLGVLCFHLFEPASVRPGTAIGIASGAINEGDIVTAAAAGAIAAAGAGIQLGVALETVTTGEACEYRPFLLPDRA